MLTVGAAAQQQPPDGKPAAGIASNPNSGSNTVDVEILSDTKGVDFGPYLASMLSQVRGKWYGSIPAEACAPMLNSGNSTVEFILSKDGTIANSKIASSSGDESLDRAALDAVKSAAPFPEFPSAFEGGSVTLRGTFTFTQTALGLTYPSMPSSPVSAIEQADRATGNAGSAGTLGTAGSTPLGTSAGPIPQGIEVLSDTKGIDFCPYLSRVLQAVRMNWYTVIPEAARPPLLERGKVSIELAILPDGKAAGMKINSPSGDVSLDRAAWGGITASNPFAPLPSEFNGQDLRLRFTFQYNPNKAATDNPKLMFSQMPSSPGRVIEEAARGARGTASGESGGNYGTGGTIPPSTSAKRIPQGVEILSDTQGVDFSEYLLRMSRAVASYWHGELGPKVSDLKSGVGWVPYQKSGVTKVEFKILRDGSVTGMKMTQPSGDAYLDRVAWNAIAITPLTSVTSHFERLPLAFKGQDLRLRFTFHYNPKKAATGDPTKSDAVDLSAQQAPDGKPASGAASNPQNPNTSSVPSEGNLEVLSDTQGVDFGPYLSRVVDAVRRNWYTLIPGQARSPELKSGMVSIEFHILGDGRVDGMRLVLPSGDVGLDRAAWGGITASRFAPLPAEYKGSFLALRFRFYYNPKKAATNGPTQPEAH